VCIFIYYMSSQKSKSNKSRSKNTIPKTKPSDYLNKYVGNTPENVRRMREIFKTDGEIYRKFPYLTKGDDRDFHIFYEYVENKHLLDEKKIFPFDDARDYSFLYWFLDEIVPQNWDKLGAGQEREKKKFRDGYYLNTSEIIEQADLNKYESLISTTMFRQSRGVMPLPPLGEKDKNNALKWRNWKIEYAKWKNQEYRLHPELSRSRNERSAPRELDEDDEHVDPLVHNRNMLNGTDRLNRENCLSDGKTPTASSDIKDYYKQLDYFRAQNNEGCQKDAQFKKVRLHGLFQEQLEGEECAEISKPLAKSSELCDEYESRKQDYTDKENLYDGKPCGLAATQRLAELESHCKAEKKCIVDEPKEIAYNHSNPTDVERAKAEIKRRLLQYNEAINRYIEVRNEKCKNEAISKRDKFIKMNQTLYQKSISNDVSRNLRPPLSSLSSGSPRSASSSMSYSRDQLSFDDIAFDLEKYKNNTFDLGDDAYDYLGKPVSVDADAKRIIFQDENQIYLVDKQDDGILIKIELNSSGNEIRRETMLPEDSFFVVAARGGGKRGLRKTKRNKNKKRQTKRRR